MNPLYLTPEVHPRIFDDAEVLYHKRNLFLLALYFDKIIICTDNILAFTRYLSKDVVTGVVTSPWFMQLVEQGIIVIAGWGSSKSLDMMKNQEEYSSVYRPELKEQKYLRFLSSVSQAATWVVREPSVGEKDHVTFLQPRVRQLEGLFNISEVQFMSEFIGKTNEATGYVGTMEIFPVIDDRYGDCAQKADSFYHRYYISWHEYCAVHYAPAIPIETARLPMPLTRVLVEDGSSVVAALYSPDLFERFLGQRFGSKIVSRILSLDVTRLVSIRNGDWARFKGKYHEYVEAASKVCWITYHPNALELLQDDQVMDDILSEVFKAAHKDADLSALGGALDVVLRLVFGVAGVAPAFQLLKTRVNRKLGSLLDAISQPDLEPFLRKLRRLLEGSRGEAIIFSRM
ncbi:MAG: hypothetical protein JO282_02475 [Alphaproteobacteria bacterium]|nr:hypothetical protein [Alphaproteobacteria bacterium]